MTLFSKIDKVKFWCGIAEAVFGTVAVGAVITEHHPWIALAALALARGTAEAKNFFQKQNPQQNEGG